MMDMVWPRWFDALLFYSAMANGMSLEMCKMWTSMMVPVRITIMMDAFQASLLPLSLTLALGLSLPNSQHSSRFVTFPRTRRDKIKKTKWESIQIINSETNRTERKRQIQRAKDQREREREAQRAQTGLRGKRTSSDRLSTQSTQSIRSEASAC